MIALLSQQEQLDILTAYQDAYGSPPTHSALFVFNEHVYQFLRAQGSAGMWRHICPQRGDQPYGVEYTLGGEVPINLPALQLISVVLQTRPPFVPQKDAEELSRFFCDILRAAGWTHPTISAPDPVPGTVCVVQGDGHHEYETSDIRPVLATLSDPSVRGLLITGKNSHSWVDLVGKIIEVTPSDPSE